MKKLGLLFSIVLIFSFCKNEKPKPPISTPQDKTAQEVPIAPTDAFIKKYQGTINEKIPIELVLINWSNGILGGYYFYPKQSKKDKNGAFIPKRIELSGELNLDEKFYLDEYADGDFTGKFTGSLSDLSTINGNWNNADSTKTFSFNLTEVPSKDLTGWTGAWYRNEAQSSGTLIMGNVTEKTVDFALEIFNGGHSGVLDGTASLNGRIATFKKTTFDEVETCDLVFQINDSLILIDQKSSNWACGFGMRAHADGKYENKLAPKDPVLTYGKDNSVFTNKEQHDLFKKLVGKHYEDFAFNLQDVGPFPKNPKDDFEATAFAGNVIGLAMTNEAIIMKNGNGMFWAAVIIHNEENDQFQVKYFTNDQALQSELPQTIEDWRKEFSDYKIVM